MIKKLSLVKWGLFLFPNPCWLELAFEPILAVMVCRCEYPDDRGVRLHADTSEGLASSKPSVSLNPRSSGIQTDTCESGFYLHASLVNGVTF